MEIERREMSDFFVNALEIFYSIGSIYESTNPTPPPVGEWKEITDSPYQFVSSQTISGETSGSRTCDWTVLVNSYTTDFFVADEHTITCPAGYHFEYKLEALTATKNNNRIILSFGGIETGEGITYNTIDTWKKKIATPFFTLDDVVYESIGPKNSPGIQVKYKVINSNADWRIYYPTVQTYIVPDEPVYKYQRIS